MIRQPNRLGLAIARKPAILISALGLALAAAVGAAYQQSKSVALERTERILDAHANIHKDYFADTLGKYWMVPEVLASAPAICKMLIQPTQSSIGIATRFLEDAARNIEANRLFVMDTQGTTLAASMDSDAEAIVGKNFRFRPYFQQAMSGHTGQFIGIGMTSKVLGYYVSRPVIVDGEIKGVATMRLSLPLSAFRSAVQRDWKIRSDISLITDHNGVILMSPFEQWIYKSITVLPQTELDTIKATHQYADKVLTPLPVRLEEWLNDKVRFVQFSDIPDRRFIQKSYPAEEFDGRLYLHVDADEYRETVLAYTGIAALLALALFLAVLAVLQRWSYQVKLLDAAIRDPLTGLYTRLYMNEWMQAAIKAHARDPDAGFALLLFDVDHFKQINDTYGHLTGDAVLKSIGRSMSAIIRAEDLAVRFGGEELAIFIRHTDADEVLALAERIRLKLQENGVHTEAGHIPVTVSGGIAHHAVGESSATLFDRADRKLYEAKKLGRNQICA